MHRFCVRAGARHVYATDVSSMIHNARKIAAANGMSDKITFIQGKVEEAELPQVDIIVSEWMGFCLLSEIMLDCLLQARDKHLVPGGLMFPDRVSAYVAGIEDGQKVDSKVDCELKPCVQGRNRTSLLILDVLFLWEKTGVISMVLILAP